MPAQVHLEVPSFTGSEGCVYYLDRILISESKVDIDDIYELRHPSQGWPSRTIFVAPLGHYPLLLGLFDVRPTAPFRLHYSHKLSPSCYPSPLSILCRSSWLVLPCLILKDQHQHLQEDS